MMTERTIHSRIEGLAGRPVGPVAHSDLIARVDAAVFSVLASQFRAVNPAHSGELFAGRLLAQRHVEGLAHVVREVRVAPGTVITPMARDLLKRRSIAVRIVSRNDIERVRKPGEWAFAIESTAGLGVLDALRRGMLDEGWWEHESFPAVSDWIVEAPGRGGLLLTDEASVAVWRACQEYGLRAATACEPEAIARAVARLGVNLLVVEPSGKSLAYLKQFGNALRRAGAPTIPEGLS